ncbi:MAG: triphosphoribosyl-dephospho-CoA synthase [Pirellulales bacterium]|nr:triphosphoribosyl-dephospho-CoA synthase [Pirellulales bacterium]
MPSLSEQLTLACIFEATAAKPGNVHPGAAFFDACYLDFVHSAVVSGPIVAQAGRLGVGRAVLEAVQATREAVGKNTNLGTLLLLAPLAAVPAGVPLAHGIGDVLERLTPADTRHVYAAIRTAGAGGLGNADEADVSSDPPASLSLVPAMTLAADRDLVARQYANQFADIFQNMAPSIEEGSRRGWSLMDSIVHAHLGQLSNEGDSLILRKCGAAVAEEARQRASHVLAAGEPTESGYNQALVELDAWLRADGHRRNPGTTADLITAALFVLLRENRLNWKSP